MTAPNGPRFGGWLLNTAENRFGPVGDFDGDGEAELLVTGPWGIGILWGSPHLLGSWLNGQIIIACPPRSHQRLFRNDSAEFSVHSLFARPAVDTLKELDNGGWDLMCEYSYPYPHIYPTGYAVLNPTEKPKYVVSTADFLATLNGIMDPRRPLISQLKATLADDAMMTKAAAVYANASALVWRTLANDAAWNPFADPGKHTTELSLPDERHSCRLG